MIARCIALVGLPGSGKSTWAEANDDYRTLIFDSTALTRSARRAFTHACQKHRVPVDALVFTTSASECIARQAHREKVVPAAMIRNMARDYEPPSREEGYR